MELRDLVSGLRMSTLNLPNQFPLLKAALTQSLSIASLAESEENWVLRRLLCFPEAGGFSD